MTSQTENIDWAKVIADVRSALDFFMGIGVSPRFVPCFTAWSV